MIQVLMLEPNAPTSDPKIAARAVIVAGFMEIRPELFLFSTIRVKPLEDKRSKRQAVVALPRSICEMQSVRCRSKDRTKYEGPTE